MAIADCFSQSYAEARPKFLAAARAAGLAVRSHEHPNRGRDDEPVAMDVVRLGPSDAPGLLVITSACHGVEGFCGSGVQVSLLGDAPFIAAVERSGCSVLMIHALNPYGFSWWRRTTQENFCPDEIAELRHRDASQRERGRVIAEGDPVQCAQGITPGERPRRGCEQRVHENPATLVTPAVRYPSPIYRTWIDWKERNVMTTYAIGTREDRLAATALGLGMYDVLTPR